MSAKAKKEDAMFYHSVKDAGKFTYNERKIPRMSLESLSEGKSGGQVRTNEDPSRIGMRHPERVEELLFITEMVGLGAGWD